MAEKKVALVTGGATGMGRACAERLAKAGFNVAVNYHTKRKEAQELLTSLEGTGHHIVKADVADGTEARRLIDSIAHQMGHLDVLVNAAGVFEERDITKMDYKSWSKTWMQNLNVNLMGPVNLAFCAAVHMRKRKSGKIINITSRGAFRGEPKAPAYGAAKAALNSASQSLAQALAPYGISVYAIAPGWVETPLAASYLKGAAGKTIKEQSPLGRVGKPEEIAGLVAYLASADTEYLTGSIIDANGASYLRN